MKKIILGLLIACYGVQISTQQFQYYPASPVHNGQLCYVDHDITYEYRSAQYNVLLPLSKLVAVRSNLNFVFSPISTWIMLAAIAEGADTVTQQKLFKLLHLPNDPCIRQAYYQLATTRVFPSDDVNIKSTRVFLIDDATTLNPNWYDFITRKSLLEVVRAPIRYNPKATAYEVKRIMSARFPRLDLSGNSVLLDTMDYNGLWTKAFEDAVIKRAPFYNLQGEVIGAVDLMRMQRRVRMGYIKNLHAKFLELPVGSDKRYRMLFGVIVGNSDISTFVATVRNEQVFEIISSLRPSRVPIDMAIPRTVMTSEIDVKAILEDLGVNDLWNDPGVTRYISNPPALPSSFLQRTTVVLNTTGLNYAPSTPNSVYNEPTGLDPILGRDFIADRPFMFGLFDAETYTLLITSVVTQPTYT